MHLNASSTVGTLLGSRNQVPALHHQAVQHTGEGLVTVAWADDQVIEAIELPGHAFAVGVQWHPEEGDDLRLFEALVSAAQAAAAARASARAAEEKAAEEKTAKQPWGRGLAGGLGGGQGARPDLRRRRGRRDLRAPRPEPSGQKNRRRRPLPRGHPYSGAW